MEPDNRIWANSDLWKLWCWCLDKANFTDKRWISVKSGKGLVDVEIRKGQFVYGRHSAAEALGINPSTLRDRMIKLANLGFISISPDSQYSIITICNYEYYLIRDDLPTTATPEARRQSIQTSGDTTYELKKSKNEKNLKNEKKKEKQYKVYVHDESFEKFYKIYPKKKNRADAEKAWRQLFHLSTSEYYIGPLADELLAEILEAVKKQKESKDWLKEDGQFIPYPATWLRGKRWQDEVEVEKDEEEEDHGEEISIEKRIEEQGKESKERRNAFRKRMRLEGYQVNDDE